MPKPPNKKKTVKKKFVPKRKIPRLIYLRFRIENKCRCGGTYEVVLQPGWCECASCATYSAISQAVAKKLLKEHLP